MICCLVVNELSADDMGESWSLDGPVKFFHIKARGLDICNTGCALGRDVTLTM